MEVCHFALQAPKKCFMEASKEEKVNYWKYWSKNHKLCNYLSVSLIFGVNPLFLGDINIIFIANRFMRDKLIAGWNLLFSYQFQALISKIKYYAETFKWKFIQKLFRFFKISYKLKFKTWFCCPNKLFLPTLDRIYIFLKKLWLYLEGCKTD